MDSKSQPIEDQEPLPFHIGYLPQFALEKCELELNETPEKKVEALQELRSLLQKHKVTSEINFHDDFLVQYLRHNKYRMNKTVQHLQNFVNLNRSHRIFFQSIPDEYFLTKPSTQFMTLLPKRCPDGCTMILFRQGKWDPNDLPFDCVKQIITMTFSQVLRDPMSQINGFKLIQDFSGTNFVHLKYCTPYNLYLFYHCAMNCVPARYKGTHLINPSFVLKAIWTCIKPLLSEKIRNRVYIHSKVEELFDHFPRSVIPVEYGGTLEDISTKDWIRKANAEHREYSIEGWPNFY